MTEASCRGQSAASAVAAQCVALSVYYPAPACAQELGSSATVWSIDKQSVCYEITGLSLEQQLSATPADNDPAVKYYRGFNATTRVRLPCQYFEVHMHNDVLVGILWWF